jgi:uncharacterized protein
LWVSWYENIAKRQVKSPKIYLADSGLLHALLNLRSMPDIEGHPKVGASWEGFVLEQVIRRLNVGPEECFFWATHSGAELDLLVIRGSKRIGFEIKRTSSPRLTPSMRNAISDLGSQHSARYPRGRRDVFVRTKGTGSIGLDASG